LNAAFTVWRCENLFVPPFAPRLDLEAQIQVIDRQLDLSVGATTRLNYGFRGIRRLTERCSTQTR